MLPLFFFLFYFHVNGSIGIVLKIEFEIKPTLGCFRVLTEYKTSFLKGPLFPDKKNQRSIRHFFFNFNKYIKINSQIVKRKAFLEV